MVMSIDEAIKHLSTYSSTMGSGQTTQAQHEESKRIAKETMSKYQQLQADYENRLKADMAAMLNEVKAEIMNVYACDNDSKFVRMTCRDIIQEKINSLKEDTNQ